MSKSYHLEALVASLEQAEKHARISKMDVHFMSELHHLTQTAKANQEEKQNEI